MKLSLSDVHPVFSFLSFCVSNLVSSSPHWTQWTPPDCILRHLLGRRSVTKITVVRRLVLAVSVLHCSIAPAAGWGPSPDRWVNRRLRWAQLAFRQITPGPSANTDTAIYSGSHFIVPSLVNTELPELLHSSSVSDLKWAVFSLFKWKSKITKWSTYTHRNVYFYID